MKVKIWRRSVDELFLLPGMPRWPEAHMQIIAMEADEYVLRRICMRVTRGCDGVAWEIASTEARESDIIGKVLTDMGGECVSISWR